MLKIVLLISVLTKKKIWYPLTSESQDKNENYYNIIQYLIVQFREVISTIHNTIVPYIPLFLPNQLLLIRYSLFIVSNLLFF